MAGNIAPNTIIDDLIFYLDIPNDKSYLSGSNTCYSLCVSPLSGSLASNFYYYNSGTLQFATSSYIRLENSKILDSYTNITLDIWVNFLYLDYTGSQGNLLYLYQKGNPDSLSPNSGVWLVYDNRYNVGSFRYTCFGNTVGGYGGGTNNFGAMQYNTYFTTGSWNNISITINNNTGSLYINGVQKGANKLFSNLDITSSTSIPYIGLSSGTTPSTASLKFANFKLYKRALSSQEILQNYNSQKSRFGL